MPKGYSGRILRVNLTKGKIWVEEPSEAFYRRHIGGQGFIAHYLLNELPEGADPLGPDNLLIFALGPFTGVPVAGAGRNAVGAKSPLTGGYGEADVGGFFGAELKRAGYDAVVITGKAKKPVYLWIHDGEAELRSAEQLWGTTTLDCREALQDELQDKRIRLANIGPAGEKLVRYACILNDLKHAAGRTGLGAVMGAKGLKAVVVRGTGKVDVADEDSVKNLARWMGQHWKEKVERLHDVGSAGNVPILDYMGVLPTRNFREGKFAEAEKISGQVMRDTILIEREGCYACPIRCKRVVEVDSERYHVDPAYGGPEYETVAAFGSNCGVDDLEAVAKANELCNAYGVDTISTGGMVAFVMECFEQGYLTAADADDLDLHFGNAEAMVELTRKICEREGIGDMLAEGPRHVAEQLGAETTKFMMTVKNQNLPMHECRARHGQALGYAVSPTGADHMHNFWDQSVATEPLSEAVQSLGIYEPIPPTELSPRKVRAYTYSANWSWVHNHVCNCMYVPWTREQLVEMLNAITGWSVTTWELLKTSERSTTMARLLNLREGLSRDDDQLPERLFSSVGDYPGLDPETFEANLSTFYGMMGWEPETGQPVRPRVEELDIVRTRGEKAE